MAQVALQSEKRPGVGKGVARKLRASGKIPAVLYGPSFQPVHLAIPSKSVEVLVQKYGMNPIINLSVEGGDSHLCMIKDLQKDVFQKELVHLDLRRVDLNEKIEVSVPLILEGEQSLRAKGGIIEQTIRSLRVKTVPTKIPDSLTADISHLKIGQTVPAGEVKLPEGVELAQDKDQGIVNVFATRGSALASESHGG